MWVFFILLLLVVSVLLVQGGMEHWQPFQLNVFSNEQELDYDNIFDILSSRERSFLNRIIPNKFCSRASLKKIRVMDNYSKLRRYKPHTFNLMIDGEAHHTNYKQPFDLILTTKLDRNQDPRVLYIPQWSKSLADIESYTPQDLLHPKPVDKKNFCAFMYSNCFVQKYEGVRLRHAFFEKLSQRKRVDSLGVCLSNTPTQSTRFSGNWSENALERYKPYRFVISFENTAKDGYITEKMILPLLAGSVPIYWGAPDVASYFNPKRFISVRDFNNLDACIERVLQIENNPKQWRQIVDEPIIEPRILWKYTDWYFKRLDFYPRIYSLLPEIACPSFEPMDDRWKRLSPSKPIKVINLDRSKDRWNVLLRRLEENQHLKNQYERFSAVDGKHGSQVYESHIQSHIRKINPKRQSLTQGEVGIYLSFLHLCYALVHDPKNDYYLILEDDVYIDQLQSVSIYAKEAPKNWDILFLGSNREYCPISSAGDKNSAYSPLQRQCMPGNFACMIRKRAAQYYVNFGLPIEVPIDEFHRMSHRNLNMYVRRSQVVTTDYANESTIH